MNWLLKKIILLLVGTGIILGVSAQEFMPQDDQTSPSDTVWTLQECVKYAIEHNLQVKQTKLDQRSDEAGLLQSKIGLLPSLSGDASHSYQYGRSIDPTTNDFVTNTIQTNGFSLSSNVVLFDGFRKLNTLKQNRYWVQADQSAVQNVKNNITLSVLNSYLQILLNREQLTIARNQLEISKQQLKKTNALVEVGKLAEGELLDIEAQVANEELNVTKAQNQLDLARTDLKILLRLDSKQKVRVMQPDVTFQPTALLDTVTVNGLYKRAVTDYPSVVQARYEMMGSEKGVDIAQSQYVPTLSVFGRLSTNFSDFRREATGVTVTGVDTIGFVSSTSEPVYQPAYEVQYSQIPFWEQLDENFSQSIGISLSIPIFNGWQTRTNVEQAKVNTLKAQYTLQQAKDQLKQDIQQAFANAKAAQKQYLAAEKNRKAAQKAFDYAEKRLEAGAITSIDYVDAKSRLSNAESELTKAKFDFIFRVKILEFYLGKGLNLK